MAKKRKKQKRIYIDVEICASDQFDSPKTMLIFEVKGKRMKILPVMLEK